MAACGLHQWSTSEGDNFRKEGTNHKVLSLKTAKDKIRTSMAGSPRKKAADKKKPKNNL